jgi:hypothetical protein
MNEEEWLQCQHAAPMLSYLRKKVVASDRKLRLFACACLRRISHLIPEEGGLVPLEVAERFADGQATMTERIQMETLANRCLHTEPSDDPQRLSRAYILLSIRGPLLKRAPQAAESTSVNARIAVAFIATEAIHGISYAPPDTQEWLKEEVCHQAQLLRDVFFKPLQRQIPRLESSWRHYNDRISVRLAESIYDERAFDRLPILADALEDAGCDNPDILAHCRKGGQHVRGCWVVDLLLGKK